MKEEERLKKEKQDMLGFYDYTVVLTYISLVISVFGMTRALAGDFKVAILCLALSGLCDMFDGKIARTKKDRTDRLPVRCGMFWRISGIDLLLSGNGPHSWNHHFVSVLCGIRDSSWLL